VDAGAIRDVATGFQSSRILLTAIELRLFSLIGGGSSLAELAAGPRATAATDRLLNALCAMRLCEA